MVHYIVILKHRNSIRTSILLKKKDKYDKINKIQLFKVKEYLPIVDQFT